MHLFQTKTNAPPDEGDLTPSQAVDFQSTPVQKLLADIDGQLDKSSPLNLAVSLFYQVRDQVRYNPYLQDLSAQIARASTAAENRTGFCVSKAALLAAVARAHKIPARLGFADVTNHLSSPKLIEYLGSNRFVWHGWTELWLEGKWVKATPAFHASLCKAMGVAALDFDGPDLA